MGSEINTRRPCGCLKTSALLNLFWDKSGNTTGASSEGPVSSTFEQPTCNDGSLSDTSGLCADGSQPQPQGQAPENVVVLLVV